MTYFHSKFYAYDITKQVSSDSIAKLSPSLFNASVDLNPHQLDAPVFAFRSPLSRGAILADEVGLGKTIEAGIIISQLWAERKRRILVIAPSTLRKQWAQELADKFYISSRVFERSITHKLGEYLQAEFRGQNVDCEYNRNGRMAKEVQFRFNEALKSEVEKLVTRATEFAKQLEIPENEYKPIENPLKPFSTYPDIIIHTCGKNHPHNILIIEVKKYNAGTKDDFNFDFVKLKAFTSEQHPDDLNKYHYLLGIHLVFFCNNDADRIPVIRFFRYGEEENQAAL